MYERSSAILDQCFYAYKLLELNENTVFMSDRVLCKLPKTQNLVVKNTESLQIRIKSTVTEKKIKKGDRVGILEIYDANGLIFSDNLYSIVDN